MTIHNKAVFISAGREQGFFPPIADTGRMERLSFRLPAIEAARHAHGLGRGMRELEAHRHQWQTGTGSVVVIVIVFHIFKYLRQII